jgi:hypothetical protein
MALLTDCTSFPETRRKPNSTLGLHRAHRLAEARTVAGVDIDTVLKLKTLDDLRF